MSGPGARPALSLCDALALSVSGARRCLPRFSGPSGLCVTYCALSASGPGALFVGARRSLCRGPALSLCQGPALFVGPGALRVGAWRSLFRGPALSVSGPGALSLSVSGHGALSLSLGPALSLSLSLGPQWSFCLIRSVYSIELQVYYMAIEYSWINTLDISIEIYFLLQS